MKQPYFSVGEEVILQSRDYPEYNGEYAIYKILYPGQIIACRLNNKIIIFNNEKTIAYVLDDALLDKYNKYGHISSEIIWHESALRKKYKPSSESFEQMMNNLKKQNVNS